MTERGKQLHATADRQIVELPIEALRPGPAPSLMSLPLRLKPG
jgi:hypothetical protein